MKGLCTISLVLFAASASAQDFIVSKAPFSSRLSDEFSPVHYGNGLVFCTTMRDNSPVSYSSEEGRLFRMFFVEGSDSTGWKRPVVLSEQLTSGLNDGPATFTPDERTIYFSRNNRPARSLRNITDISNKLGIFTSTRDANGWTDPVPFTYNDPLHSFCTPHVTPNGNRLFFASDMPGGYGGMDLYVCEMGNSGWSAPVNLGPAINTIGNEAFPFAGSNGLLWFASDGRGGMGSKDLFFTSEIDGKWTNPVNPGAPLNSSGDDFGLIVSGSRGSGFFSSNRSGTDDIYSFAAAPPDFGECIEVHENNYCFTFYDERRSSIDTLEVKYTWDFDGETREGEEAWYCFPGPGRYEVYLTITDQVTGDTITRRSRYDVDLKAIEQGYIKCPEKIEKGKTAIFDGTVLNLTNFNLKSYYWDFGEGFVPGGPIANHTFRKAGEYEVRMGLKGENPGDAAVKTYCFTKKLTVN